MFSNVQYSEKVSLTESFEGETVPLLDVLLSQERFGNVW